MKIKNCLLLIPLLLFSAVFQAQENLSLNDAINYAMEHSFTLKNAQINVADADAQVTERMAVGLPQVRGEVSYQYFLNIPTQVLPDFLSPVVYGVLFEEGLVEPFPVGSDETVAAQFGTKHNLTAGVSLNTMVFDWSYFIGLKAAKFYKQYIQQEVVVQRQEIKNQTVEAYLPCLLAKTSLSTLDSNILNLEKLLFETKALYEEGFVEELDVDRLELSLANLRTEHENLKRQYESAISYLKFTIGYPMNEPLTLEDDINSIPARVDNALLSANINYQTRPEYSLVEMGTELSQLQIKLDRSGYYPNLYAFGSYQQSLLTNDLAQGNWFPTSVVGLQLNVPIFDGLRKKARMERSRLELERLINLEISNARAQYSSALKRMESQEKNLALAQKIYDTTQIKYREGVGSSLELTQAEQSLYQSQQNFNRTLYDLLIAKFNLQKSLGQ